MRPGTLVAGLFVVEERGAHQLKGVPQPVVLYRVVQPSGMRSRLDLSAGRHTPFVGRQSELGVLADAWERVVDGVGQTVLVQGEAGIGKSRLCYQLREQLGDQPHTWLECRCSPYTSGTPFRPVIELVEQALAFQLADTAADKLGKLTIGPVGGGPRHSGDQRGHAAPAAVPPTRPPPAITAPSPSPASRGPALWSCAPRRASPACGAIRASAPKRATPSPRSTAGSPRASTPAI